MTHDTFVTLGSSIPRFEITVSTLARTRFCEVKEYDGYAPLPVLLIVAADLADDHELL